MKTFFGNSLHAPAGWLATLLLWAGGSPLVAAPVILVPPRSQTVVTGGTAVFSVSATGIPPLQYQWRSHAPPFNSNFTNIPGATAESLLVANAQPTTRRFSVVVSDITGSVTSAPAALTVVAPVPSPTLLSAGSLDGGDIGLRFSKVMSPSGLDVSANYQVTGRQGPVDVQTVLPWPGNTSVVLRLSQTLSGEFTVAARQLTDTGQNPIDATTVTGHVQTVRLTRHTVGTPVLAGLSISVEEGRIAMHAGGNLPTDGTDDFEFLYQPRTNDFDFQVRVDSVIKHGTDSPHVGLAGLMVRNSVDPNSPLVALLVSPTFGNQPITLQIWRNGGLPSGTYRWGTVLEGFPSWLRLHRTGGRFRSYTSSNAVDWVEVGEGAALLGATPEMVVGLCAISYSDLSYLTAEFREFGETPAPPGAQPVLSITRPPVAVEVEIGHQGRFAAAVSLTGLPEEDLSLQWQAENPPGSGNYTNIPGGTGPLYVTDRVLPADDGRRFRLWARARGGVQRISAAAVLTVRADVTPPRVISALPRRGRPELILQFSEPVAPETASDPANYAGNDFGVLGATVDSTGTSVTLALLAAMATEPGHEITVTEVTDTAGNTLAPNPTTVPVGPLPPVQFQRGGARQELYFGIPGTALSGLRGSPQFPDHPDRSEPIGWLEGPVDIAEDYGTRLSGFLIPPVSGRYNFWMSSDDQGEFWLSTDASPANAVLLCREPSWNGWRQYNVPDHRSAEAPENRSATLFPDGIPLTAGEPYYFEALAKEGGGGDNLAVAWQLPGQPPPTDGGDPIPGAYLGFPDEVAPASIEILQQPSNAVAMALTGSRAPPQPLYFQDFNAGEGGFTARQAGNPDGAWRRDATAGSWVANGSDGAPPTEKRLTSPSVTVTQPGEVRLRFRHRFSFEQGNWDGGAVRVSVNQGPFEFLQSGAFLSNGYTGTVRGDGPLFRHAAFANTSDGYGSGLQLTSAARLGVFAPGDRLRFEFVGAWDWNTLAGAPSWAIDEVELTQGLPGLATAGFSIRARVAGARGETAVLSYVWQRDCGNGFTDLPGAHQPTLVLLPSAADRGCRVRCLLFTPGGVATSGVATLTLTLPGVKIVAAPNGVEVHWPDGVLQEADFPGGPWNDVPQATTPWRPAAALPGRFYRAVLR